MKTKNNYSINSTEELPVVELSLKEQMETDGGGDDRERDKQSSWWDKVRDILMG